MLLVKTHLYSVVLTPNARYMTIDISNFYLNTPMIRPEYFKVKLTDIPDEVIDEYNLRYIATLDGYMYVEVTKGMYGLPQAGLLANKLLEKRLNEHGYIQSKIIPGLWKHKEKDITFTLVVDDFGVKYIRKADAEHLLKVLKENYQTTEDWSGRKYIGLTIDWDYKSQKVHLSMPGYVVKSLKRFNHDTPSKPQHLPFPHTPPPNMEQSCSIQKPTMQRPLWEQTIKKSSSKSPELSILCESSRPHYINGTQRNCSPTSLPYTNNNG